MRRLALLVTLAGSAVWTAGVVRPAAQDAAATQAGQILFNDHCAGCHGPLAEGGSGPDLTNPRWHAERTDAQLADLIANGVPNTPMPPFADRIDPAGRQAIVALLRTLGSRALQPATTVTAPPVVVSPARLARAPRDPGQWLMYGGDYGQTRYTTLDAINRSTVANLVPVWSFQTGVADGLTGMPLVVDGVIFLTTAWNHAFAIDARTGAELWHYQRRLPPVSELRFCCGPSNRGLAIWNDLVFMATLDAHLVALETRTGRVRWDVELGQTSDNLNFKQPPLVIGDRLLVGSAGGDSPSRGFIDAYDAATGRRLWRFYTIPAPGEPGSETWPPGDAWKTGGGAPWMQGTYDPDLNLVYWSVGQPWPAYDGAPRPGDNLYSNSVVALDPRDGSLKWHYQFTPHELWDYDGVTENVPLEIEHNGRTRRVIVHADRNGYFYAIDRTNGEFLFARPFVRTTWTTGLTRDGRPIVNPGAVPTYEGVEVCPGAAGGKQWTGMAYSPLTRWVYVPVIENCATFFNYGVEARAKGLPPGPSGFRYLPGKAYGRVLALDPANGDIKWAVDTRSPMSASMLATAGGLVFTGDAEGNVVAFDDRNGELLWSYQTGSGIRSGPVAFRLDGVEYIAVASGLGGAVGGYTGPGAPWLRNYRGGGTLYVFRLFEPNASKSFHGGARTGN
jgi:alcohol dehydrogenase (cytochrome c)